MKITIETRVEAPRQEVWNAWTTPEDIEQWNAATEEWHCPAARLDLRVGGDFSYRMEARDGSMSFDFSGTFTKIVEPALIEFVMEDERPVTVEFRAVDDAVQVRETFEAESENAAEQQRQGWQAILENFARHVQAKASG